MSDHIVRQRVGITPVHGGWSVLVKLGSGSVVLDALYPDPSVALWAAEHEARRLAALWYRLRVPIVVSTWAPVNRKVAA